MMSENENLTMEAYFAALEENQLIGSKCKDCGAVFTPPRIICSKCQSTNVEKLLFNGKGILETFSLVHVGTRYFANQGYAMRKPYCFGVIKLEEGPRVSAHVVGENQEWEYNPENFKIGMKLKMKILEVPIEGKDAPKYDLGFTPE